MKRILLSAAIVASLSSPAYTATVGVVSSNITGLQLWINDAELLTYEPGGYFSHFQFGGTVADNDGDQVIDEGNLTFTGVLGFNANMLPIRVTYDLGQGIFTPGSGVTFTAGTIAVEIEGSEGWVPYSSIDADVDPVYFLKDLPGHWQDEVQKTAGIVSGTLPGLWDGAMYGAGFDQGVGSAMVLGFRTGLFLEGTLSISVLDAPPLFFSPSEVPVPAAAWLFGPALLGLAGVRRLRKPSA